MKKQLLTPACQDFIIAILKTRILTDLFAFVAMQTILLGSELVTIHCGGNLYLIPW